MGLSNGNNGNVWERCADEGMICSIFWDAIEVGSIKETFRVVYIYMCVCREVERECFVDFLGGVLYIYIHICVCVCVWSIGWYNVLAENCQPAYIYIGKGKSVKRDNTI